jgi:hypothetical protein
VTYPHKMDKAKYDAFVKNLKVLSDDSLVQTTALKIDGAAFFNEFSTFDDEAHACWEECGRRETAGLYDRAYRMACGWNGVKP